MINYKLIEQIIRRKYPKYQKKEIFISAEDNRVLVQIDDNVYMWRNNVLVPAMK